MSDDVKWFVVHTYSGYENKVAADIEKVVENRKMQDEVLEVKIPTETVIEKVTKTRKVKNEDGFEVEEPYSEDKEVIRKLYPSYVFVKVSVYYDTKSGELKMTDETWYLIRNTRGVTGFVGPEGKPTPLTEKEVYSMGVEKRTVEVNFSVGDLVSVIGGPFDSFQGTVDKIDADNDLVRVIISMMGRETPIELGLDQVEPALD